MKNWFMAPLFFLALATHTMAAERKPLIEVDTDDFSNDTQVTLKGAGDQHVAFAWWIPNEFWASILARDNSSSEADKDALLNAMTGVSILAIVQADISNMGAFHFYSKDEVKKNMTLSFSDSGGSPRELSTIDDIDSDLQVVLGVFKPILEAAMGNLGSNMHFYVLADESDAASRILNPYQSGEIQIELVKRNGDQMAGTIGLPVNALYVPRTCPNGKSAHITWNYCPWSGAELEE